MVEISYGRELSGLPARIVLLCMRSSFNLRSVGFESYSFQDLLRSDEWIDIDAGYVLALSAVSGFEG